MGLAEKLVVVDMVDMVEGDAATRLAMAKLMLMLMLMLVVEEEVEEEEEEEDDESPKIESKAC